MAQFLITYDNHPPRDYSALYRLMAGWNAVRLAESVWLANLNGPASTVRDIVATTLDNFDTVSVLQLQHGTDWASQNVSAAANAWLSAYVAPSQMAA
jgi:hypothetical protein